MLPVSESSYIRHVRLPSCTVLVYMTIFKSAQVGVQLFASSDLVGSE